MASILWSEYRNRRYPPTGSPRRFLIEISFAARGGAKITR